jgi:type IV pilus assembly protein PilP
MIGFLNINKKPMAVIQVEDKVKQVKVGDYMGLDFGMVTQISDREVELRELIQDSAGDWSERKSTLYLQSKEGSKK